MDTIREKAREACAQWDRMVLDAIASGEDNTRLVLYARSGNERHVVKDATLVRVDGAWWLCE